MNMRYCVIHNHRIVCISTPFEVNDTVMTVDNSVEEITHFLDVLGFYCPVPLHETKKALEQLSNGDVIGVKADDPETLHDIPMYLGRTSHILRRVTNDSGEYYFIIEVNR